MTPLGHQFLLRCLVCLDATTNWDPFTDSFFLLTLNLLNLRKSYIFFYFWDVLFAFPAYLAKDQLHFSPLTFFCFACGFCSKNWVVPGICLFQDINFTHSLLSSLTMRTLCNEGVIKLGSVWKCQTSQRKKEQSSRRHLSFYRVSALHVPDAHVHVLIVSFMMSGFESVMCSEE